MRIVPVMVILAVGLIVLSTISNMSVVGIFNTSDALYFAEHYSNVDCMNAEPLLLQDDLPDHLHDRLIASYDCSGEDKAQVRLVSRVFLIFPTILIFGLAISFMFKMNTPTPIKQHEHSFDKNGDCLLLGCDHKMEVPNHDHRLASDMTCLIWGCAYWYSDGQWVLEYGDHPTNPA